jgi:hypothetical protein
MSYPPVPPDADLRDFHFMPLDVARLSNSDLAAIATGEEFKVAVILWCKCWHQVPASSLPDDDRMLAHLAGFGRDLKGWRKVKNVALRGFIRCDDGRLYHPVIADKVNEALDAKRRQRERTANATKARQKQPRTGSGHTHGDRDEGRIDDRVDGRDGIRDRQRHKERNGQRHEERNVVQETGTEILDSGVETRARDPDAILEHKLRQAAGWQSEPAPMLAVTGEIQALIDSGADLDLDVLPVVKALAPQVAKRVTWRYFVGAIARQRDQRIAAATVISIPSTTTARASYGLHRQKPTRDDTFAAIDRRIDEIERQEAAARATPGGQGGFAEPDEGAP